MMILDDGRTSFAGPTRDLKRPVGFRLHGYAPFDLDLFGKKGDVVDVGEIKMQRLPESELVRLKGLLTLEGSGDPTTATMSLSVANGPVNTPSNGIEGRRRWAKAVIVPVGQKGLFDQGGFSPIKYYCSVRAPGYVTQSFAIDFGEKDRVFTGRIRLEKPRRAKIQFIQQKDDTFDIESIETTVVKGGDRWKVTPEIYGWDLEFKQDRAQLYFNYSYAPCLIADLGEGELKDFLDVDEEAAKRPPRKLAVQDGHVYLLRQEFWNHTVLFKIQTENPERRR